MSNHGNQAKTRCEDCLTVNVDRWSKSGHLAPGSNFTWGWTADDGQVAYKIAVRVEDNLLRVTHLGHDPHREQVIHLAELPCNYGGRRGLFRCPTCDRRVVKLYLRSTHLACRCCQGLAYASQLETPIYRGLGRANHLRVRLGGNPGMGQLPDKPPGMHSPTYKRMVSLITTLEQSALRRVARRFPCAG